MLYVIMLESSHKRFYYSFQQTRVLKNDFARYNVDDDEDIVEDEDNGWKIIHTDVFRFPQCRSLFTAILGMLSWFGLFKVFGKAVWCIGFAKEF